MFDVQPKSKSKKTVIVYIIKFKLKLNRTIFTHFQILLPTIVI